MQDSSSQSRFAFLDALRGVAALGVLFHHLYFLSVMDAVYEGGSPSFVTWLCRMGARGVEVFFVLSGFIIAHSLRANPLSRQALWQFIIRRQVRLDPPYWAALAMALALTLGERLVPGLIPTAFPTGAEVVLNVFYLQHLFHLPQTSVFLDVSWTLCLEIQFYLLFVVVLAAFQRRTTRLFSASKGEAAPIALATSLAMWLSGAFCLLASRWSQDSAYFWSTWQYFVLGTLSYWAMRGKIHQAWLWSFVSLFALSGSMNIFQTPVLTLMNSHQGSALVVGCTTAVALFVLGRRHSLSLGADATVLQYFGKISYSLYLTHTLVILVVMRLAYKLTGDNLGEAVLWFAVCGAACVGAAHLFYHAVERPTLLWANTLKAKRTFMIVPETKEHPSHTPTPARTIQTVGVEYVQRERPEGLLSS